MRRGGRPTARGQNLGAESGSRKRKAGVMSKSSVSPADNGEHLEVAVEDTWRVKKEIEDLRSQLDDYVKELGYCDENEKLRVELALKMEEMECLGKQNEKLEAKNCGLLKQNEELLAKNDVIVKWNEDLQAKNDSLVKQIEDLQAKNYGLMKQDEDVQAKNDVVVKQNEGLQAKNDVVVKQNEELRAKNDGLVKQNEELQAKNNGLVKQNEKLHTKNDMLREQNGELQAKNGDLSFQNEELRGKIDDLTRQKGQLQAKNDGLWKSNEKVKAKNDILTNRIDEQNDGLMKRTEEIVRLKAQVIKLFTTVNQLMANNSTLVGTGEVLEEYDAIKEEVAAYAAELKCTRKKNKDLSGDIVEEKRNLGEESGSRKRKAAGVSKSLTSLVGNGDQEAEMAQETLEDESCFSLDLLSLAMHKYFETNKELIEARRELLWVFEDRSSGIGVKRMGELDQQPFKDACRRKYVNNIDGEVANLVSIWAEQLKDPSWHPFKIVEVNGQTKQVVDDDDTKLRALRADYGDAVCEAVKTAVMEINEHNPSGGYPVPELWHLGKGRKGTVSEALRELVR